MVKKILLKNKKYHLNKTIKRMKDSKQIIDMMNKKENKNRQQIK